MVLRCNEFTGKETVGQVNRFTLKSLFDEGEVETFMRTSVREDGMGAERKNRNGPLQAVMSHSGGSGRKEGRKIGK